MAIKVCKFGGSSVASVERQLRVRDIVEADADRRFIVPSAPGKRHSDDTKVTDLLYLCHRMIMNDQAIDSVWGQICDRFTDLIDGLQLDLDLTNVFNEVRHHMEQGAGAAYAASRGEALNGHVVAALLGATYIDAADVIKIGPDQRLDPSSYELIKAACSGEGRYVIPGFYGSGGEGEIRTFSRGGSDVTGSIVACALDAEVYENWTDVPGVLMTDPRIIPEATTIKEVTYGELRELSYMGASVLHDEAVFPVRDKQIPINIRDTGQPEHPGTMIVASRDPGDQDVVGIAGTGGFTVFAIERTLMNTEIGFGRRVLDVFERLGISYEHTPTGIDTMSVVVSNDELANRSQRVVEDLHAALSPDRVEVYPGMALIATVGKGMNRRIGTAARLMCCLATAQINIRMLDQGSSEQNIIIGVEEADLGAAIRAIYDEFTGKTSAWPTGPHMADDS